MNLKSKILRLFIATAACVVLAGCGSDDDGGPGNIVPNNNAKNDAGNTPDADVSTNSDADDDDADILAPDAQDPDTGDEAGDTDTSQPDEDLCGATNLGTLSANESISTTGDLASAENNIHLSCAAGIAPELMYSFSVEEPSRVSFRALSETIGTWSLQINRGVCDETSQLTCFETADQTFFAEADVIYHLLIEPSNRATTGEVKIYLETEALGCFPALSATCNGDEIERCEIDYTPSTSTCPEGCSNDTCNGDTCQNPIEMDPSGTMQLEGSLAGLTDTYNFNGRDECFESGNALPTRDKDLVVALNGLSAGQMVHVDASEDVGDANDNAIFIVQDCGATPTCIAGGDSADEKLDWEVPDDGDYLLIIDHISATSDLFSYQITVDE